MFADVLDTKGVFKDYRLWSKMGNFSNLLFLGNIRKQNGFLVLGLVLVQIEQFFQVIFVSKYRQGKCVL